MRKFLAGAAIVTLIATATSAKPGGGGGPGGGHQGGGNPHAEGPPGNGGDRGRGNDRGGPRGGADNRGREAPAPPTPRRAEAPGRGGGQERARFEAPVRGPEREFRGNGQARGERPGADKNRDTFRAQREEQRRPDRDFRGNAGNRNSDRRENVGQANRHEQARAPWNAQADRGATLRETRFGKNSSFRRGRGAIDGCPPGLAKKDNGCMPPGLAGKVNAPRAVAGTAGISLLSAGYSPIWYGYNDYGPDYRYYDGYLVRTSGERVLGYVPLLGGALSIGAPWPAYYEPEPLPPYWVEYYDLGPPERYRYYDDVIYEIDPGRSDIEEIVALMTGDSWAVGRPMPIGYDVYNVPYTYRTRYYDGPQHWYRYSDGYVYDIDPTTRLVLAVVQLLA